MSEKLKVKIRNPFHVQLPDYATEGSAGMDIRANIPESKFLVLKQNERGLIPTGLFIEIPKGMEGQIRPRSGLALNQGITVLNSPGTIDSDYRGEIKILLVNISNGSQVINHGSRIAQIVFSKCEQIEFEVIEAVNETERGKGGFGSTGIK